MDYEKIIRTLIDPIVEEPKSVLIRIDEDSNGKDVNILVAAEKKIPLALSEDMASWPTPSEKLFLSQVEVKTVASS